MEVKETQSCPLVVTMATEIERSSLELEKENFKTTTTITPVSEKEIAKPLESEKLESSKVPPVQETAVAEEALGKRLPDHSENQKQTEQGEVPREEENGSLASMKQSLKLKEMQQQIQLQEIVPIADSSSKLIPETPPIETPPNTFSLVQFDAAGTQLSEVSGLSFSKAVPEVDEPSKPDNPVQAPPQIAELVSEHHPQPAEVAEKPTSQTVIPEPPAKDTVLQDQPSPAIAPQQAEHPPQQNHQPEVSPPEPEAEAKASNPS